MTKVTVVCEARTGRKYFGKPRFIARWKYGRSHGSQVGNTRAEAITRAISEIRSIDDMLRTCDITKEIVRQAPTADRLAK